MQLTAAPNFDSCELQIAPLEEVEVCCRLQDRDEPTSTTGTTTTSGGAVADTAMHTTSASPRLPLNLPLHYYHLKSTTHLAKTYGTSRNRDSEQDHKCTCSQDSQSGMKRKFEEDAEVDMEEETDEGRELEAYRRLLVTKKRILNSVTKGENIPLFYLYGDLLLIPKFKWVSKKNILFITM